MFSALCCSQNASESPNREIIGSGIFEMNKTRHYMINDTSKVYLDSMPIDIELFEIIGSGFTSKLTLSENNSTLENGVVNSVQLITNIIGPVTSINPLKILEQEVLITSDTVSDIQNISLNQIIGLSGYIDENNSYKASKMMASNQNWKIQGYVSNLNGFTFNISSLTINMDGIIPTHCESGLYDGAHVEVNFLNDTHYTSGIPITTISSVSCIQINELAEVDFYGSAVIQGFVTEKQGNTFNIEDVLVKISPDTVYVNGEYDFIHPSVNVEVEGLFNSENI